MLNEWQRSRGAKAVFTRKSCISDRWFNMGLEGGERPRWEKYDQGIPRSQNDMFRDPEIQMCSEVNWFRPNTVWMERKSERLIWHRFSELHTQAEEFGTRGNPLKHICSKYILRFINVPLQRVGVGEEVCHPVSLDMARVFGTFNILAHNMCLQERDSCRVSCSCLTKQLVLRSLLKF